MPLLAMTTGARRCAGGRDGEPLRNVQDDPVVDAFGQRIAVVESGDARQRGLLAAAFLCFCG